MNPSQLETVFARRLREIRYLRGLTREQLAEQVHALTGLTMSAPVIKKIEQGGERARNVSITELFALAATLNVGPAHLLTSNDEAEMMAVPTRPEIRSDHVRAWIRGMLPLDHERWLDFLWTWPESERKRSLRISPRHGLNVETTPAPSGAIHGGFFTAEDRHGSVKSEQDVEDAAWELTEGEDQRLGRKPLTDEQKIAEFVSIAREIPPEVLARALEVSTAIEKVGDEQLSQKEENDG